MTIDTAGTRYVRTSNLNATMGRAKAKRPVEKEDAGMYSGSADRPYNKLETLYLRFVGLVLGRQIV